MRRSLQVRLFKWLTIQTTCIFLVIGCAIVLYNLKEGSERPDLVNVEKEEMLILLGVAVALLPISLYSAWSISKQMRWLLQPIFDTAEQVRSGNLDRRIHPVERDDEIGMLSTRINEAFDRYHDALERLERFSFDASHQLRNPLTAIRASGEICLQRDRTSEEYRQTIGMMLEDVERLSRTVEQLLTLARLAHRDLAKEFETFAVKDLIGEIVEDFQAPCELKEIELKVSIPDEAIRIHGVRYLLREAISNVMDNAVRFTPEKGRIGISLSNGDANSFMLSVADSGPGLPSNPKFDAGFRGFRTAEGGARDGAGLGLAIVIDIIKLHQGSVAVAGSEWGGARFDIMMRKAR